jgi:hypothetical protein
VLVLGPQDTWRPIAVHGEEENELPVMEFRRFRGCAASAGHGGRLPLFGRRSRSRADRDARI